MRIITHEEIDDSVDRIHAMTDDELGLFAMQMNDEQPYIQIYLAAKSECGDFEDENDVDALFDLASIIVSAMRAASGGRLAQVTGDDIDTHEAKMMELYHYAAGEEDDAWPELIATTLEAYNQRPLLEFVLEALMSPENRYEVTPDGSGLIFTYIKVIIDCLDQAKEGRRS